MVSQTEERCFRTTQSYYVINTYLLFYQAYILDVSKKLHKKNRKSHCKSIPQSPNHKFSLLLCRNRFKTKSSVWIFFPWNNLLVKNFKTMFKCTLMKYNRLFSQDEFQNLQVRKKQCIKERMNESLIP